MIAMIEPLMTCNSPMRHVTSYRRNTPKATITKLILFLHQHQQRSHRKPLTVHFEYLCSALDDLFQASSWKIRGNPNHFLVKSTGYRTVNIMVLTTCHKVKNDASSASISTQEARKEEEPHQPLTHLVTMTCKSLN